MLYIYTKLKNILKYLGELSNNYPIIYYVDVYSDSEDD